MRKWTKALPGPLLVADLPRAEGKRPGWEPESPCVVCGEACKGLARAVHVVDGGGRFLVRGTWTDDASDLGAYPVGPRCWRKVQAAADAALAGAP